MPGCPAPRPDTRCRVASGDEARARYFDYLTRTPERTAHVWPRAARARAQRDFPPSRLSARRLTTLSRSVSYDFAVLRAVPPPHRGVVFPSASCSTRGPSITGMLSLTDIDELRLHVPKWTRAACALPASVRAICDGRNRRSGCPHPALRAIHWVTAPRSDVIQSSPIHEGVCAVRIGSSMRCFGRTFVEVLPERQTERKDVRCQFRIQSSTATGSQ